MNVATQIINGKQIADDLTEQITQKIKKIKKDYFLPDPCLAVILVGDDPASHIYVNNKKKKAEQIGIISKTYILSSNISQLELISLINTLNMDEEVHGILLQLPLPKHLNTSEAIFAIDYNKDVDGFNPFNVGLLNIGKPNFIPCTPLGCIYLLEQVIEDFNGLNALIIGRSNVVGWPMSKLLLDKNCTVTIAHSSTKNLKDLCLQADIIICAVGKKNLLTAEMVNEHAVVIDVGINRYIDSQNNSKIIGDADFVNLVDKVRAITPVPGGVGPMTIAFLMSNVLKAFVKKYKID